MRERDPDYDIRETRDAPPPLCVTACGLPLEVLPEPELMSESDLPLPADVPPFELLPRRRGDLTRAADLAVQHAAPPRSDETRR